VAAAQHRRKDAVFLN